MIARTTAWIALFAAPAMWLVMLMVAYPLVPWACHTDNRAWLWVTVAVTLALALVGLPLARRARAAAGAASNAYVFLCRAAYWTTLGFAFVIVASAIPIVTLSPCLQ